MFLFLLSDSKSFSVFWKRKQWDHSQMGSLTLPHKKTTTTWARLSADNCLKKWRQLIKPKHASMSHLKSPHLWVISSPPKISFEVLYLPKISPRLRQLHIRSTSREENKSPVETGNTFITHFTTRNIWRHCWGVDFSHHLNEGEQGEACKIYLGPFSSSNLEVLGVRSWSCGEKERRQPQQNGWWGKPLPSPRPASPGNCTLLNSQPILPKLSHVFLS